MKYIAVMLLIAFAYRGFITATSRDIEQIIRSGFLSLIHLQVLMFVIQRI